MGVNGLEIMSGKINYLERVRQHLLMLRKKNPKKYTKVQYFWEHYLDSGKNINNLRTKFSLNDSGDILILIKPSKEYAIKRKR